MAGSGPGRWVGKAAFVMPDVPETLDIDPVLLAVLHADAFLQLSEDEAVDPDAAIEASESIGHYLRRLPPARVETVKRDLERLAAHARREKWPRDLVEFIRDYWENAVGDDEP